MDIREFIKHLRTQKQGSFELDLKCMQLLGEVLHDVTASRDGWLLHKDCDTIIPRTRSLDATESITGYWTYMVRSVSGEWEVRAGGLILGITGCHESLPIARTIAVLKCHAWCQLSEIIE